MKARRWTLPTVLMMFTACGKVASTTTDAPLGADARPIDSSVPIDALTLADQRVIWTGGPGMVAQVMSIRLDGTDRKALTTNTAQTLFAAPTQDGTKIVYTLGTDLFLVNPDGTGLRQLTTAMGFRPAFSGDGSKIAFVSNRAGGSQIFVMTTASGDAGQVVQATTMGTTNTFPAFSPDGTKVTYTNNTTHEIMLVDLQTLAVTNLTNNPAADDTSAFSRDGTKLAFSSDRDGTSQIWVANADGSNPVKVTTDAVANKFFPSFDRDATHVVYFAGNPRNLYIAPVSGGPGVALTTDADKVQEKLGSWIF